MNNKPTILIDFDGCIHSYEQGWQDGRIYGTVVPGFWEWANTAKEHFILAIYSSRSAKGHKGIKPMMDWLTVNLKADEWEREDAGKEKLNLQIKDFIFPDKKPAAYITIDDRAICFTGNWDASELKPETIRAFKSWVQPKESREIVA